MPLRVLGPGLPPGVRLGQGLVRGTRKVLTRARWTAPALLLLLLELVPDRRLARDPGLQPVRVLNRVLLLRPELPLQPMLVGPARERRPAPVRVSDLVLTLDLPHELRLVRGLRLAPARVLDVGLPLGERLGLRLMLGLRPVPTGALGQVLARM